MLRGMNARVRSCGLAALMLACCAGLQRAAAVGNGPGSASHPVPRTDPNSRLAHEQLVQKAKQGGIDVYFVGDSITRRWGASRPAVPAVAGELEDEFLWLERRQFRLGSRSDREYPLAPAER